MDDGSCARIEVAGPRCSLPMCATAIKIGVGQVVDNAVGALLHVGEHGVGAVVARCALLVVAVKVLVVGQVHLEEPLSKLMCALRHINGGSFRLGLWRCHALGKVGQQKARPQQTVVEQIGGLGSRVAVGLRLGVDEVKRQMAVGLLAIGIQADGGVDDQRVERQHGAAGTRAPFVLATCQHHEQQRQGENDFLHGRNLLVCLIYAKLRQLFVSLRQK